jgi:sugar porter (SP) family MFS transporter
MGLFAQLLTAAVLKIAIVNIIGGGLFGFTIGFVPIYSSFMDTNTNCTLYLTSESCNALQHTTCHWLFDTNTSQFMCQFDAFCDYGNDENLCEADNNHDNKCIFDHSDKICKNAVGWDVVQSGIFAGAMIVGGLLGSLIAGKLVNHLGRKRSLFIVGLTSLVASGLIHIAAASDIYGLLIVGRVLIGAACGLACVCCPMYVEEMAPDDLRKPIGVFFQISCTLGIVIAAGYGLLLNPTDFSSDVKMGARFQAFVAMSTLLSALTVVVAILIPESTKWSQVVVNGEDVQLTGKSHAEKGNDASMTSMAGPLTVAVVMCLAQQMTGINAIMNYAPNITKSMNLKPLTGNFFVMLWNFITTLVSIPIANSVPMSKMFLTGTIVASLACLCTGIPVYPGMATGDTKHALAGLGIAVFIAAFEIGMGPAFYVLAQELFPSHFRPVGSSFTMVVQFIFNIIINICFPIAVQGLSGGPNGDQDKGMGITFMFFGCVGTLSWFVLVKFLRSTTEAGAGYQAIGSD